MFLANQGHDYLFIGKYKSYEIQVMKYLEIHDKFGKIAIPTPNPKGQRGCN